MCFSSRFQVNNAIKTAAMYVVIGNRTYGFHPRMPLCQNTSNKIRVAVI